LVVIWRSLPLALVALFINALPVGLVVALQGFAGVPLNAITIMVAAVAFGIAVDDTIHFITHWRMARERGLDSEAALKDTLEVKGRPIVCTTLILAGILCVFGFSSFPPVVHFGFLLAAGLAGALVAALGLLPAWLGRNACK
jgi:predicted RND superfamily exporter protein